MLLASSASLYFVQEQKSHNSEFQSGQREVVLRAALAKLPSFFLFELAPFIEAGFPGGSDGKESACNVGDPSLIPGSGRSPGEGNGTYPNILAWRIPWTKEPGEPQSMWLQRVRHD